MISRQRMYIAHAKMEDSKKTARTTTGGDGAAKTLAKGLSIQLAEQWQGSRLTLYPSSYMQAGVPNKRPARMSVLGLSPTRLPSCRLSRRSKVCRLRTQGASQSKGSRSRRGRSLSSEKTSFLQRTSKVIETERHTVQVELT